MINPPHVKPKVETVPEVGGEAGNVLVEKVIEPSPNRSKIEQEKVDTVVVVNKV